MAEASADDRLREVVKGMGQRLIGEKAPEGSDEPAERQGVEPAVRPAIDHDISRSNYAVVDAGEQNFEALAEIGSPPERRLARRSIGHGWTLFMTRQPF
jgi:hypothetical protein